jgi:hypothetical protein
MARLPSALPKPPHLATEVACTEFNVFESGLTTNLTPTSDMTRAKLLERREPAKSPSTQACPSSFDRAVLCFEVVLYRVLSKGSVSNLDILEPDRFGPQGRRKRALLGSVYPRLNYLPAGLVREILVLV